jgi:hypothetical protein
LCGKFDVLRSQLALRCIVSLSCCSSLTTQHLLSVHYRTRHCYALHNRKTSLSPYWSNCIHADHFRLSSCDSQGSIIAMKNTVETQLIITWW